MAKEQGDPSVTDSSTIHRISESSSNTPVPPRLRPSSSSSSTIPNQSTKYAPLIIKTANAPQEEVFRVMPLSATVQDLKNEIQSRHLRHPPPERQRLQYRVYEPALITPGPNNTLRQLLQRGRARSDGMYEVELSISASEGGRDNTSGRSGLSSSKTTGPVQWNNTDDLDGISIALLTSALIGLVCAYWIWKTV